MLGFCVLGGAVLLLWYQKTTHEYSDSDARYNFAYWEERIETKGAEDAYREFTERNLSAPTSRQHLSAHVMGELIFSARGVEGITVCDSQFSFGCYHGFFGRAISEGGEAAVSELDAECVEAFGELGSGCQHGIGHGILEYVGHDRVQDALALCAKTTQPAPLLGCPSGVFMEYNTPLMRDDDGVRVSVRKVTADTVYEPCVSVSKEFQSSCFFQLGQWLALSLDEQPAKLGALCSKAPLLGREYCFLGAGDSLGLLALYDVPRAIAACASISINDDEVACRAGISWALFSTGIHRERASGACAFTDNAKETRCRSLADLTEGRDPH